MRKIWTLSFLGITAAAVLLECIAAFDGNSDTIPWTEYIVGYIPFEIFILVFVGGTAWVGYHFISRYIRRKKL